MIYSPYVIFEIANVHGGSGEKVLQLIAEYKKINYPKKAIKFQPLKPDQIALPDFHAFGIYEKLYFSLNDWNDFIGLASESGDVWLDLFDVYGVEVLQKNKDLITGIKLQASVLDNIELISALSNLDLSQQQLMINISGYEISNIQYYITKFEQLNTLDIILQLGFQAYPTSIDDTGLQKIPVLKAAFPDIPLCIADHASAETIYAKEIPSWGVMAGCSYVEKHFCYSRKDAEFDFYSALEPSEFSLMLDGLSNLVAANSGGFVSVSEKNYLEKSYQAPILKNKLNGSSLIGLSDLSFKRTNQNGLNLNEIITEQSQYQVTVNSIEKNSTVSKNDFRKAKIGVFVACRMKSSRLKKKAIQLIYGVSSVERCLQNCLLMKDVDDIVLATSTVEDDAILKNYTLDGKVKFWQGDPDDVIKRYLGACDKYGTDVIVRVTADCPVISPEIMELLLKNHFEAGADYTAAISSAVGSSPEIYNVEALRRVLAHLGNADYSEYMTWYMQNNPDIFKVNLVELPDILNREYRLTLDYPEDLKMFDKLYSILDENNYESTLLNVFKVLDENALISKMNQHLTLSYKTDPELINKLNKVTRITDLSN